jgi:lambda family phage portal protein
MIGLHAMHGSPEFDAPQTALVRTVQAQNHVSGTLGVSYESGAHSRRTARWHAPTTSPNTGMLGSLSTIRGRSRAAIRNDGFAEGIIDALVRNIIGTGILIRSTATDDAFRRQADALWTRWTLECDADGLLSWEGMEAAAVRAWLEGGEVFARLRPRFASDGLSVPLQVQLIEPELCPHDYTLATGNGNIVRAGLEFSPIGRRVGVWFYSAWPGDFTNFDAITLKRVPAELILQMYQPLRPGQLRGLPILTQALSRLFELDKFDDATLMRQQIANMFTGFVTRPQSGADALVNPLTGEDVASDDPLPLVSMEPGIFQELDPGSDVKFSSPPDAGQNYPDFMKRQLRSACAAAKVPYEVVTNDLGSLNDRVMRVILNEFRRGIMAAQRQIVIHQLCRPVWRAWMTRAFLSGALPIPADYATNPEPYWAAAFVPQGWPYLNPVQDVESSRAGVRAGFSSRTAEAAAQGEDSEEIDRQQQLDNARADALHLKYDSDGRQALNAKGTGIPAPPDSAGAGAAA